MRRAETLLVLDATTGQNAVHQAGEFNKAAELTGIILTKLDGTAKGRHRDRYFRGTGCSGQAGRRLAGH